MTSNGDSFTFLHSEKDWQNLKADEAIFPLVTMDMPVVWKPVVTMAGGVDETYTCKLMFAYDSNLDDNPDQQYSTLKLAHSALNNFIQLVEQDSANFDTSKNDWSEAYQAISYPLFDRNIDAVIITLKCVPRIRPNVCIPSYSLPVGDCDPATVESSGGLFSQIIASGETFVLPDNNYTITDTSGNVLASGTAEAQTDLSISVTAPCTGIAGYKGSSPYYTLPSNNVFGHAFRLCGITGGYTDGVGYFDVNGAATTRALAFPDGIICDLYRVTCNGDFIMYQDQFTLTGNVDFATASAFCASFTLGGFSGWQMMDRDHFDGLVLYDDINNILSYKPFENSTPVNLWTGTELFFGGTYDRVWIITQYQGDSFVLKTQASARAFPVRITNISEL